MKTPERVSPYTLIQEVLRDDPWKLLVAVQCLNLTSAKQAIPVLGVLFRRASNPHALLELPSDELVEILRPLGLFNRRSKSLVGMTKAFINGFSDPLELPGIGKYGADSYNIFISGYIVEDVTDKELKNYVRWALEETDE